MHVVSTLLLVTEVFGLNLLKAVTLISLSGPRSIQNYFQNSILGLGRP